MAVRIYGPNNLRNNNIGVDMQETEVEIKIGQTWKKKRGYQEIILIKLKKPMGYNYDILDINGKITAKEGYYNEKFIKENFSLLKDSIVPRKKNTRMSKIEEE